MLKNSLLVCSLSALCLISTNTFAFEINKKEPLKARAIVTDPSAKLSAHPKTKEVFLMNMQPTAKQLAALHNYHPDSFRGLSAAEKKLPPKAQVSMNVPVLDQGRHGTCVTFAVTAAMDALLGKGDYISQLCSLELGSYLEANGSNPSGWDGSLGPLVINQLLQFGAVSKNTQQTKSCAGVTEYPTQNEKLVGKPLTLEENKLLSENLNKKIFSYQIMTALERVLLSENEQYDGDKVLTKVKEQLVNHEDYKSLLTFGVYLPVNKCSVGACAKYHEKGDTWAITSEIIDQDLILGGHEMVITGYDDDAVAFDNQGKPHKGLLTLRNSWGSDVGDQGNYYMTYDFFKIMELEVNVLITDSSAAK